jgi:hypothetical protein
LARAATLAKTSSGNDSKVGCSAVASRFPVAIALLLWQGSLHEAKPQKFLHSAVQHLYDFLRLILGTWQTLSHRNECHSYTFVINQQLSSMARAKNVAAGDEPPQLD